MNTFARHAGTSLCSITLALVGAAALAITSPAVLAQPSDDWGVALPKTLIVAEPPAGATTISEALTTAKVGQTVVLRGRIATGKDAFKEGRAAFTIVQPRPADAAAPPAGAKPAPVEPSANIQVVDDKGRVLRTDLKNKRGLRAGVEVVIVGKVAQTDGSKTLGVDATGIYVVPATLPKDLFLKDEPKDAKPVEEVKKTAKVGDTIAMRGRVGGSKEPFVDGRAVFTLIGPGLKACSDNPDDNCTIPWDYCCETKKDIIAHSATVQVVESDGLPIRVGVKGANGVKELSDLIVVGKVVQTDGKTMIVSATGVFVARP